MFLRMTPMLVLEQELPLHSPLSPSHSFIFKTLFVFNFNNFIHVRNEL